VIKLDINASIASYEQ
jgi:hypothetical protein